MEQEQGHQYIVQPHAEEEEEEMMEDGALIRNKSLSHNKGDLIINEVTSPSSSSSSSSNGSEHSNGVWSVITAPDGSSVQKEEEVAEMGDGGENSNHVNGDKEDYAAVGLAQVAEFAGAETNGEDITHISGVALSQNKNSVYFDKQQDHEVNGFNGVQNGDGLNGVLQNSDASGSVHPTNLGEGEFDVKADQSDVQNSLCSESTYPSMKTVDDKLLSSSELSHLHNSSDVQATAVTNFHKEKETSTKQAPNLKEVIDQQLEEFDVEAVLAKQETHDLFCPKCRSCITKRVILKKRKRNSQSLDNNGKHDKLENINNSDNEAELDKLETFGSSEQLDGSAQPEPDQGDHVNVTPDIVSPEPPADDNPPREAPEVFTCLSCFSLFIPSGKCFDLFRSFGGANKSEVAQNPSSIPSNNLPNPSNPQGSNANWFMSLIKGKKASDASLQHSGTGPGEQHPSASITSDEQTYPEIGHPKGPLVDTSGVKNVKPTSDINHGNGGMNSPISSSNDWSTIESSTKSAGDLMNGVRDFIDFSQEKQLPDRNLMNNEGDKKNASDDKIKTDNVEVKPSVSIPDEKVSKYESLPLAAATITQTKFKAGETAKDTIPKPYEGKPEFLVSTTVGSLVLDKSPKDVNNKQEIVNGYSSLGQGAQSQIQSSGSAIFATDVANNKLNSEIDVIFPPKLDFTHNVQKDIGKEINSPTRKENEGGDVIVDVGGGPSESKTSQIPDNIPVEGVIVPPSHTQVLIDEQPRGEVGEPQGWEIVKSIVYGGLVESITSLGIVSSAISSGATPLNIIALGFANIIGGLFILGHNLIDLKNDQSGENQTQMNAQDRYQELLGRRANFLLHAVVAVLSFLIFGAVPLVIYGVVINKNYYTEVKLAAIAASSIVCIILLAIGKVYTSRPPKSYFKTVFYYVTLALSASGISYLGGNLIKDLLEKFNHSESGFAITMPISDPSMKSAWKSY